jgi:hypothetical protein
MRKLADIKEIYTDDFYGKRTPFRKIPFIDYAREILADPTKNARETGYFNWVKALLDQQGEVWGSIRSEEDVVARVETFRNLVLNIKEHGYKEELAHPLYVRDGKIYGDVTAKLIPEGYLLIDGHHRLSILYALGEMQVYLTICE